MQQIINAMADFGLTVDGPVADGNIHRCRSGAKKKRNKDGWYLIHLHGDHYYAVFGCWIRGEKRKASTREINGDETGAKEAWLELDRLREKAEAVKLKQAIELSEELISESHPPENHPYIIKKQIQTHGILQKEALLVLPLYNADGQITCCQIIDKFGGKKMMKDGIYGGCCYPFKGNDTVVCICEGFATGASINEATGYKVLAAMSTTNMSRITREAVKKFPNSRILITPDNDHDKKTNAGVTVGKKIAEELGLDCVWPTGIRGSDFNDMAIEQGLEAVRETIQHREVIEVMGADDFKDNLSLQIPSNAIPKGSLIEQGVNALSTDIDQYSLPFVLTTISRAIAGKINWNGIHPNIFNIKIGDTSTGKSLSDKQFRRFCEIDKFFSVNELASGAGLFRAISENPHGMGLFDEVKGLFQRTNDPKVESIINALLDVFSNSGLSFSKRFGDSKNNITIENSCFSLLGNTTPEIFNAIQIEDFKTGLMQRFDFWIYEGPARKKNILQSQNHDNLIVYIDSLQAIIDKKQSDTGPAAYIDYSTDIGLTKKAAAYLQEFSDYIIETVNKTQDPGDKGIISRQFDLAVKYAEGHHASYDIQDLFKPLCAADISYGILLAKMLADWKIVYLKDRINTGDFHKAAIVMKDAIKTCVKRGKPKPTFKMLCKVRSEMLNWHIKYFTPFVIEALKKRGEIITRESSQGNTQYFLVK